MGKTYEKNENRHVNNWKNNNNNETNWNRLKQIETMEALNGKIRRLSLGESSNEKLVIQWLSKHQQAMFGDKSVIFLLETKQHMRRPGVPQD